MVGRRVPAAMTIPGLRASGVLKGSRVDVSSTTPNASSAGIQLGERPAGVSARPRISDRVEERLAFILLLAIACGIPVFARWRSEERE